MGGGGGAHHGSDNQLPSVRVLLRGREMVLARLKRPVNQSGCDFGLKIVNFLRFLTFFGIEDEVFGMTLLNFMNTVAFHVRMSVNFNQHAKRKLGPFWICRNLFFCYFWSSFVGK